MVVSDNTNYVESLKNRENVVELDKLLRQCTVLSAHRLIRKDVPLLIVNSDQFVNFDINLFLDDACRRNLDGSILTFKEVNRDPKWSYGDCNGFDAVLVAPKDQATQDVKKHEEHFIKAKEMLVSNERVNGEFYTCPVLDCCRR